MGVIRETTSRPVTLRWWKAAQEHGPTASRWPMLTMRERDWCRWVRVATRMGFKENGFAWNILVRWLVSAILPMAASIRLGLVFQMLPSVLSQVLYSRYSERNTWAFPLMPWQTPILFPTREFPNCAKKILMAFQTSRFCFTPGLLMARTYHLILPMVSGPNQWE